MERPTNDELDVEAPNESAPGSGVPDPSDVPQPPGDAEADVEAPNESAPGRHEEPAAGE